MAFCLCLFSFYVSFCSTQEWPLSHKGQFLLVIYGQEVGWGRVWGGGGWLSFHYLRIQHLGLQLL